MECIFIHHSAYLCSYIVFHVEHRRLCFTWNIVWSVYLYIIVHIYAVWYIVKTSKNIMYKYAVYCIKTVYLHQVFLFNLLTIFIMSKGSSYWGTATGKIGNTVVRVRKGVRVESMYQPNVSNPRSEGQVYQRGKFQDAVGFYKRAMANFFKLAYEDKKPNETDFNAFMRYNTSKGRVYSKQMIAAASPGIPFIGEWIMSVGSLPTINVVEDNQDLALNLTVEGFADATTTMGTFFASLLAAHPTLQQGDIVTLVRIMSGADAAGADELNDKSVGLIPAISIGEGYKEAPLWVVDQYVIDTKSAELVKNQAWYAGYNAGKFKLELDAPIGGDFDSTVYACAAAVIISRKTAGGLLTSTTSLTWNSVGKNMLDTMATDNWLQGQRKAWGSSDVILAGALV